MVTGQIHEHDCGFCDPGSRHLQRGDGNYHRINGLLVRIGSITETRMLARRDPAATARPGP
jgi:hypothetical protein